ncbi:MAG: hypothetical protein ABJF11_03710 [Reichenbachiella sp.]|uniref:hypothetical protein n=1 Tax=Reichenbachiella sp. TaxID=2184521 RepID=UPI003265D744
MKFFTHIPTYTYSRPLLMIGLCLALSMGQHATAQDLEQIGDQKLVRVSGGISTNTTFYHATGIESRRDPFYWMINANINFDFLGVVQVPFSMTISQQNKNFSQPQPFNRFGLSPKYKSVTAHLGHRSMTFSNYTLAGNLFFGVGVEVEPEDSFWRVSAMYGRFAKAVSKSAQSGLVFAEPTFKRLGYGVKVGLGKEKHNIDLILFKAKDDVHSIEITDEVDVLPEENLVLGFNTSHKINKRISFELEYAYSMFTRDTRIPPTTINDYTFVNNLGSLFTPNISSDYNGALQSKIKYTASWYQLNLSYRNIDPGYQTMGSSFLNNDLRDISGGIAWRMFKQKVNVAMNAGLQHNNLDNQLTAQVRRGIFSSNVSYAPNEKLNFNVSYSNFNSSTQQSQLRPDILTDTLEFFQVTRNGSINVNYQTNKEVGLNHTLFLSSSIQDATDSESNSSTFYNATLGHQVRIGNAWSLGLTYTYNRNQSVGLVSVTTGPILTVGRSFFENKMRTSISGSLLNSYVQNSLESTVNNVRWMNSLRVGKKHSFSVSVYYLNKHLKEEDAEVINEIRGGVNYSYRL